MMLHAIDLLVFFMAFAGHQYNIFRSGHGDSRFNGLLAIGNLRAALVVHAVLAPLVFVALAWHYFRARGARDALPTAALWTAILVVLDLGIVAGAMQRSLAMFTSIWATWLPFVLVFLAVWATGGVMATMPWPKPERRPQGAAKATT